MSLIKKDFFLPDDQIAIGTTRSGNIYSVTDTTGTNVPITTTSANSDTTTFHPFFIPADGTYYISYVIKSITSSGTIQETVLKYDPRMIVGDTIVNQPSSITSTGEKQITCTAQRGFYFLSLRSDSISVVISSGSTSVISAAFQADLAFFFNQVFINGYTPTSAGILRGFRVYDNSTNPALLHTYNGTISDYDQYKSSNKFLYHDGQTSSCLTIKIAITRIA
jgi:hypothetical protein